MTFAIDVAILIRRIVHVKHTQMLLERWAHLRRQAIQRTRKAAALNAWTLNKI